VQAVKAGKFEDRYENALVHGAAATLFAAGVAARTGGKVLWCLTRPDLFAPAVGPGGPVIVARDLRRMR
jgi:hypothetical protein